MHKGGGALILRFSPFVAVDWFRRLLIVWGRKLQMRGRPFIDPPLYLTDCHFAQDKPPILRTLATNTSNANNSILNFSCPSRQARMGTAWAQRSPTHFNGWPSSYSSGFACSRCTVTAQANPCQTYVGPCQTHTIWLELVSSGYSVGVAWASHDFSHGFCMGWPIHAQLFYSACMQKHL